MKNITIISREDGVTKFELLQKKSGMIFECLIDTEDEVYLEEYGFCMEGGGYLRAHSHMERGKCKKIRLHRLITNAPETMQVDHINRNRLDNRKSNLRICTNADNLKNQKVRINNTSGFKGVSWSKSRNKWRAEATLDGKQKTLGHFDTPEEAASAYDFYAIQHYGEFAALNFSS